MDKEEFVIEQKHLHQTIDDYKEVISDTQLKLKNLPALYPDQERRIAEQERLLHKVNKLEAKSTKSNCLTPSTSKSGRTLDI